MKFKSISFIEVEESSKEYKDFLLQPFNVGNLYFFNEHSDVLFLDWKGTDMNGWYRFVNPNNDAVLEFHNDEYKIKLRSGIFKFPIPKNVNEFISDCNRVGLDLYWNPIKMNSLFEMKIYLEEKESKEYYKQLLTKIEKENVF